MENETLEQQKAEQAALDSKKVDDVRAEIIAEYGFDEAADSERIDKLVTKTMDNTKRLSQAIGQKIRHRTDAEKLKIELAEKNKAPVVTPTDSKEELTSKDTIALIGAGVTQEEDINEVVEYARLKKVSVTEALKSSIVKTILSEKAEFRKSADATNTGAARRSSAKASDEAILKQASEGKFPDSIEEIERLAEARQASKKKKA